jgi:microcystin-dependent protein
VDGDIVQLTNSGGALPSGFAAATVYYVIEATTTTFKLSLTYGGSAVNGTTNGTGTHTVHNKFQLPDVRGRALIALDNLGGSAASLVTGATALGYTVGAQNHTLTFEQIPGDNVHAATTAAAGKHALTDTPPAAAPHNNMQPSFALGVQIRW